MSYFKKWVSILLVLAMLVGFVPPLTASAETVTDIPAEETEVTTETAVPEEAEPTETAEAAEETVIPEVTEATEETVVPEVTEATEETVIPEVTEATEETVIPEVTEATEETVVPEVTEATEETVASEEIEASEAAEHKKFIIDENWTEAEYAQKKREFVTKHMDRISTYGGSALVDNTLSNEYVEFAVDSYNGRFTVGTTGGNPNVSSDDNKILLFGHNSPSTSYTTIHIDGSNYIYGDSNFTTEPYFVNDSNISEAVYGDIRVRQIISLVENPATLRDDLVEVKYIVTNEGSTDASFGLRIMMDTMLGNNDAAPFRIPGIGDVTTEMEFVGNNIPQYWQAFDSLTNPNVVSYGNFLTGSIQPNKVQFTNWGNVYSQIWGYNVRTGYSNGDSAVSVIWNRTLASGAAETYVTRYGLSELLQDLQPPLGLTIASGSNIQIDKATNTYMPYTVTAYVQNMGTVAAKNTICQIKLPSYLDFEDSSEDGIIQLGDIAGSSQVKVERKIYVKNPPEKDVSTSFSVTVSADNAASKTLSKILVIAGKPEPPCSISELTTLDYLAFAQVAYEDFNIGETVKECLMRQPGNKWDNVWGEDHITYAELCSHIAGWWSTRIETGGNGFYAVAFTNGKGEVVIGYRGSVPLNNALQLITDWDTFCDWLVNDIPMILFNNENLGNQYKNAKRIFDNVKNTRGVTEIHVTGHSLGGLWGNVISGYSGCKGITFNAISALDIMYASHPKDLGRNFHGIDAWNFTDNANVADLLAGTTELYAEILGFGTMLKPMKMYTSNYGAFSFGSNHGMKSMVSRVNGVPKFNSCTSRWESDVGLSNYMSFTLKSLDIGVQGFDNFENGGSVTGRTSYGGDGVDSIYTGIWDDTLIGGNDGDVVDGSWGDDSYYYFKGQGRDAIFDTGGDDKLYLEGFSSSDVISISEPEDSDYIYILCNGFDVVQIYKQGRSYNWTTMDSFTVYVDRGSGSYDTYDITDFFKKKTYGSRILVGCPVNVEVLDENGNVVFVLEDGVTASEYNEYGNFYVFREENGEYSKILDLVEGYTARIVGVDTGTMRIEHRNVEDGDLSETSKNFVDVPVTEQFSATIAETDDGELVLNADTNGDGIVDTKFGYDGKPIETDGVTLSEEYIAMEIGETTQLDAEVIPAELEDMLQWTVEEGGESIIVVDNSGEVTAKGSGTAYVIVSVAYGDTILTDRCRVDVAEAIVLDGVQLGTSKLTSELFSTDYAEFGLLLMLPQNMTTQSIGTGRVPYNNGVAIGDVYFTESTAQVIFDLVPLDDGRIAVVPTEYAVEYPEELAKTYKSTVTVEVQGSQYITEEELTVTLKQTKPKLKADTLTFNSFYMGQSLPISIPGVTVNYIAPDYNAKGLPYWLDIQEDGILFLNDSAPQKNVSSKAYLLVETEEWRIPAAVAVTVKNQYKAPVLKLSATSVNLTSETGYSAGTQLKLLSSDKNETLKSLGVLDIVSGTPGYTVTDFDVNTGTFTLTGEYDINKPGKVALEVIFEDSAFTVPLTVKVAIQKTSLKLSAKTITLNTAVDDSAVVAVEASTSDYILNDLVIRGNENGELRITQDNGVFTIKTTYATIPNTTYTLYISDYYCKEVALKVKTVSEDPTVELKTNGDIDLSFPDQTARITATFKNYASGSISDYTATILAPDGSVSEDLAVSYTGNEFKVRSKTTQTPVGTYILKLNLKLPDSDHTVESTTKLKVKRTAVRLNLTPAKITLNSTVEDKVTVAVNCTTKGYNFSKPIWELKAKNGKDSAYGKLDLRWENGKLEISVNDNTEPGAVYKLLLRADTFASPTVLTISVTQLQKSAIKSSLKARGAIDVIRSDTEVIITSSYKNVNVTGEETLNIYSSADNYEEPVNHLFNIEKDDQGCYILTAAGSLDYSKQYKAQLVTEFEGTDPVVSNLQKFTVKMGSAKMAVLMNDNTLFGKDINNRVEFSLTSKDASLNKVQEVTIKADRNDYDGKLEIFSYGNNKFAVGFKDAKVDSSLLGKTVTITLNVKLAGNDSAKINTTAKLKLTVLK